MTQDHTLESQLERLLKYGTIACTAIIAIGVLMDVLDTNPTSIDLVTLGIIGFIALPVVRIIAMLHNYVSTKDIPMVKVVAIVLTLVIAGLILGIFW